MNIYVLSRRRNAYSTRRFVKSARQRGHDLHVLDPLKCTLLLGTGGHQILYDSAPLVRPDLLLARVAPTCWEYGLAVVEQFEMMRVPTVNRAASIARTLDGVRSLQHLAHAGVPVAASVMVRSPTRLRQAVKKLGGMPLVIKLLKGNFVVGSLLTDSHQAAESTMEALWDLGQNILLQQYLGGEEAGEVRAFVVDGKVLSAIRRPRIPGEFRRGVRRPDDGTLAEVTPDMTRVAARAARVMGLGVAGIDLQEGPEGLVVMDVHASPGFRTVEKLSGVDAAGATLDSALRVALRRARSA